MHIEGDGREEDQKCPQSDRGNSALNPEDWASALLLHAITPFVPLTGHLASSPGNVCRNIPIKDSESPCPRGVGRDMVLERSYV